MQNPRREIVQLKKKNKCHVIKNNSCQLRSGRRRPFTEFEFQICNTIVGCEKTMYHPRCDATLSVSPALVPNVYTA